MTANFVRRSHNEFSHHGICRLAIFSLFGLATILTPSLDAVAMAPSKLLIIDAQTLAIDDAATS